MKFLNWVKGKWGAIAVSLIVLMAGFLFFFKLNEAPPCLDADEASFAYNAFSILKTGRDEYGKLLPLRLQAFGDNRFPLITYLDIPWVALLGLNETSARMANFPFVILFPIVVYFLAKELFKNKVTGVIASLFVTLSVGLQSIGRQTHEAYLTVFFLTLATYFFVRFLNKKDDSNFFLFVLFFFIDLFGYHPTRLWAVFFAAIIFFMAFARKIKWKYLIIFVASILLFAVTDVIYKPTRVSNLLFFNTEGFKSKVYEYQIEGGLSFLYNKLTVAVKDMSLDYTKYFSPQFLAINGDDNYRFGYPGMYPVTPVEYILMFIGLYFLFKNKEKWRYLVVGLLLFSPSSAILSWAGISLTRSLFILIPVTIIAAYGASQILKQKWAIFAVVMASYFLLAVYNWDFYFYHFPKRLVTIHAWQCGYKELGQYVKENYDRFDKFYITKKNGQPYIFLLFYLSYPPQDYQKVARLSSPDEFGFGQVEGFDKFVFSLDHVDESLDYAYVGFPDDFPSDLSQEQRDEIKKIQVRTEQMFWIRETSKKP
jgi:4-amino-4-deoxy-L-arabinose transferase-like glycosyltransferase